MIIYGNNFTRLICILLFGLGILHAESPNAVTVSWQKNTQDTNVIGNVIGYLVYYGEAPRVYPSIVDVKNTNQFTVQRLKSKTPYYFAVTAYDDLGLESDLSAEVSYLTPVYIPKMRLLGSVVKFSSPPGDVWLLEQTWDFKTWSGIQTGSETNGEVSFSVGNSEPRRFFRAKLLPKDINEAVRVVLDSALVQLPPIPTEKSKTSFLQKTFIQITGIF
jgi:hypothetical protein